MPVMSGAAVRAGLVLGTLALAATAGHTPPAAAQAVRGSYVYTLSSFTGKIPYNWSRVAVDRERNEVYVLYQNSIRVFNDAGMEVHRFGDDLDLGHIADVAVDDRGDIYLLTSRDATVSIVQCSFRGEPQSTVTLKSLPRDLGAFSPNRMLFQGGRIVLASTSDMKVVTADRQGQVTGGLDLFALLEADEKNRAGAELGGLSADRGGNLLLTVPVLFRAAVLAPDGKLAWFGRPGGAPGRFNVAAGIARDSRGNILVIDKLKGAVQVFDRRYNFVTQFAGHGHRPGQLIFPDDLVIDGRDRVYVTQMGKRGVSVFQLTYR